MAGVETETRRGQAVCFFGQGFLGCGERRRALTGTMATPAPQVDAFEPIRCPEWKQALAAAPLAPELRGGIGGPSSRC